MRALVISLVVGLVVAPCGDDGDSATVEAGPGTTATTNTTESTAEDGRGSDPDDAQPPGDAGAAWCATWSILRDLEEPTPEEIRGGADVPTELQPALDVLSDIMARSREAGEDPRGAELVLALDASTTVEAWAHEQCGGDPPFCLAWQAANELLAMTAFPADDPDEQLLPEDQALELVRVALEHAPQGVTGDADTVRAWLAGGVDGDQERAAEDPYDALDAWVDQHCPEPPGL